MTQLLSKEYDKSGRIKIERVKEILKEMELKDYEIHQLTKQLTPLCDKDGYFNFEDFVSNAF